ncbi:MAG: amidohydrolase/deacetylase family metallohydrolase [Bryobacterales bacterium]|nr:amidohydrolase/deacetylase family metallohydrolase [Bryobacterales bacterium]
MQTSRVAVSLVRPTALAALCLLPSLLAAQAPRYDLLLQGGHVIDPKNGVNAVKDVAIRDGRIAAVADRIPPSEARKTIRVAGLYVTPGLVDIHVHVFTHSAPGTLYDASSSVNPDDTCLRAGVTTVVDAGTAGWRSFPDFQRRIIDRSKVRVLAMLNIVGTGMLNNEVEQNPVDMQPEVTAEFARKHRDVIVGIKSAHWRAASFVSVEKAVEAGKLADLPVMVDYGSFLPGKPYQQMVLDIFRPGDMSTHFFRVPAPLIDENEKVMDYLHEARRRGVKFDVGHGGGSFYFRYAEPMAKQGFYPDSISTDLHANSVNGSMIDMLNVMSKFLALGAPLDEVIRMSTTNPATQVKRPELGQIAPGAEADIAVLRLDTGDFGFVDVRGGRITGRQRLGCEMTLRAGKILFDFNGRAGTPWREAAIDYPVK